MFTIQSRGKTIHTVDTIEEARALIRGTDNCIIYSEAAVAVEAAERLGLPAAWVAPFKAPAGQRTQFETDCADNHDDVTPFEIDCTAGRAQS